MSPLACDVLFNSTDQIQWCTLMEGQLSAQTMAITCLENDVNSFFLTVMGGTFMHSYFQRTNNLLEITIDTNCQSTTALVLFMHSGFAMLSAGSVRSKNIQNILLWFVFSPHTKSEMAYF